MSEWEQGLVASICLGCAAMVEKCGDQLYYDRDFVAMFRNPVIAGISEVMGPTALNESSPVDMDEAVLILCMTAAVLEDSSRP